MNKFSNLVRVKNAAEDAFGSLASVDFQNTTYIFYIGPTLEIWYFTVNNANPLRPSQNGTPIKLPTGQPVDQGYSMFSTVTVLPTMNVVPTPFGFRPVFTPGSKFEYYKYLPLAAGVWNSEIHVFYPEPYGNSHTLAEIVFDGQNWNVGTIPSGTYGLHKSTFLSCSYQSLQQVYQVYYVDPNSNVRGLLWNNNNTWQPGLG
ncbi:hypothetical protein GP486_005502 [Trichoglossum hirsutum]|uniref:Uncharacterized protein n=1 Tax=Trichoglossum hirsutum TaxID=265104 RepID=A0A9P8L933_9PEZI|nr:hypothetical protein GP486_005502 [Trichoglossum hirsutum]